MATAEKGVVRHSRFDTSGRTGTSPGYQISRRSTPENALEVGVDVPDTVGFYQRIAPQAHEPRDDPYSTDKTGQIVSLGQQ